MDVYTTPRHSLGTFGGLTVDGDGYNTGGTITDLNGTVLPASPYGYDPERLVTLPDTKFVLDGRDGDFLVINRN